MFSITLSNDLALITQLIKEQKPPQPISPHKSRQTNEGYHGNAAEGELRNRIVRPTVAAVAIAAAGEHEMGERRNQNRENEEDEPGEARGPRARLIDAEPFQPRTEAVELVAGVGYASRESGFIGII